MSSPLLPPRLTIAQLAELWSITRTRVLQLVQAGKFKRGADGKVDTAEAQAFRAFQMTSYHSQVLQQAYGNRFASGDDAAKAKGPGMARAERRIDPLAKVFDNENDENDPLYVSDPLDIDDPLEIEEVRPVPATAAKAQSETPVSDALVQGNLLTQLKLQKMRAEIERVNLRKQREAGEVVLKTDVHKAGADAGKLIASILRNLPSEIAAMFVDPETKADVRTKVQERVDQAQHAIYVAAKRAAGEDAGDANGE